MQLREGVGCCARALRPPALACPSARRGCAPQAALAWRTARRCVLRRAAREASAALAMVRGCIRCAVQLPAHAAHWRAGLLLHVRWHADAPRAQGKRKSSKPPPKKVAPKLDKLFTCPFCNHEKSVSAKLCAPTRATCATRCCVQRRDASPAVHGSTTRVLPRAAQLRTDAFSSCVALFAARLRSNFETETGSVQCNTCNAKYETHITTLSDAIDVYSDWIDACEAVNPQAEADKE